MAGYSGTPLAKKLGIKSGHKLGVSAAPPDFKASLGKLPDDVKLVDAARAAGPLDVVVAFSTARRDMVRDVKSLKKKLDPAGGLWIAWPKRASGVPTDLTENVVRETALAEGLVDNKVCAIDDTWSGLRLVYRLADRPAKPKKA